MNPQSHKCKLLLAFALALSLLSILVCYLLEDGRGWRMPKFRTVIPFAGRQDNSSVRTLPSFVFYVRFTYSPRWANEYRNVLVRSMKLFVPSDMAKLLVVLDAENPQNKQFGADIKKEWPYPDVCYLPPGDHGSTMAGEKQECFGI